MKRLIILMCLLILASCASEKTLKIIPPQAATNAVDPVIQEETFAFKQMPGTEYLEDKPLYVQTETTEKPRLVNIFEVPTGTRPEYCVDVDAQRFRGPDSYYVKDKAEFPLIDLTTNKQKIISRTDSCKDENTLLETRCVDNTIVSEEHPCPYGCRDGACLMKCLDSTNGDNTKFGGITFAMEDEPGRKNSGIIGYTKPEIIVTGETFPKTNYCTRQLLCYTAISSRIQAQTTACAQTDEGPLLKQYFCKKETGPPSSETAGWRITECQCCEGRCIQPGQKCQKGRR